MMFGHDMLAAGSTTVIVAGGMESMTNAPAPAVRARASSTARRSCSTTWRWTAWKTPTSAARRWACSPDLRAAIRLHARGAGRVRDCVDDARKTANEDGSFDWEIAPVTLAGRGGDTVVKADEQPFKARLDKIAPR